MVGERGLFPQDPGECRMLWNLCRSQQTPSWKEQGKEEVFQQKIQPQLAKVPMSVIRSSIGVSKWCASKTRQGYRPHPRHWDTLARLAGISGGQSN